MILKGSTYRQLFCFIIFISCGIIHAQDDSDILSNEWIDFDQDYYYIEVAEDGLYKLSQEALVEAGLINDDIKGSDIRVYHMGQEQTIYVSSDDIFSEEDYILFYGEKNRGELDAALYENPNQMQLNPRYSLYSDTSRFYITLDKSDSSLRWELASGEVSADMPEVSFYWHQETSVYSDSHFKPKRGEDGDLRLSQYDTGEGFGSALRQSHEIEVSTEDLFQNGPDAVLTIRHNGNDVEHLFNVSVNDQSIESYVASGYHVIEKQWQLSNDLLSGSNKIRLAGENGILDKSSIAYVDLRYPRSFNIADLNQYPIYIDQDPANRRVKIQSNHKSEQITIIDLSTNKLIFKDTDSNGELQFPINGGINKDHQLILTDEESINSLQLKKIEFVDYGQLDSDYIILSDQSLSETEKTGRDEVQAYAEYRESVQGGSHDVLIVDIDQLYHQFAYGVSRHPLSVKQFSRFASTVWDEDLNIFIIGKGREYFNTRTSEQINDTSLPGMHVPTYGYPGSDNLLLSARGSIAPRFASGRLAAKSPTEIRDYLDKIKRYETANEDVPNALWRKRVLHLSGGSSDIQDVVFTFLEDLDELITESQVGADVITFKKTSTAPIQPAESQEILQTINQGLSMITFLGHSAPGTFDFSLEQPVKYDNEDGLPILLSLGCHSGNIHSEGLGLSEDFVLEPDKGSIAFIASSSSNYIDVQYLTGRLFYELMGGPFFNAPIGEIMREALRLSESFAEGDLLALNEQFTLHGDPAIRIYQSDGPDYTIESSSVKTEPAIISSTEDSITFQLDLINRGKYIAQDLSVRVQLESNDQTIILDSLIVIDAPAYDATLSITIASPGISSIGKNVLYITLNEDDVVSEFPLPFASENNKLKSEDGGAGYCFFILDNSITPLYPDAFAIVTEQNPILYASTSNAFATPEDFLFSLDTVATFDSPALSTYMTEDASGLISQEIGNDLIPHTVYYWKVVSVNESTSPFEVRSFIYRPDDEAGWNQSHYQQLNENTFDGLYINAARELNFDTSGFYISIHNRIYNPSVPPGYQFNLENFAASVNPWLFMESGIAVVIADPISGSAWLNEGGSYGSIASTREASKRVFGYDVRDSDSRANLINLLQNEVPEGHYIFLFTVLTDETHDLRFQEWSSDSISLIEILKQEGAALTDQLLDSGAAVPYNLIYQKGRGLLAEGIAESADGFSKTDAFIPTLATSGRMMSEEIGPAQIWGRIELDMGKEAGDNLILSVFGINEGKSDLLLSTEDLSSDIDLSMLNADLYPYVRLELEVRDETQRTPPDFDFWRVHFTGLPDIALHPQLLYSFDEAQDSDSIELMIALTNISKQDITETEFVISIDDDPLYIENIPALSAGESTTVSSRLSTQGFNDRVLIQAIINPSNHPTERYRSNNIGLIEYELFQDLQAPVLTVLFDGIDIKDGDIVSPTPSIRFTLIDEGARRSIDDISYFDISLQLPDGDIIDLTEEVERLSFGFENQDSFVSAQVIYDADFADGDYTLTVTAYDVNGNPSETYEKLFKVISKKRISDVSISPNPASDFIFISFEATGEFDLYLDLYNSHGQRIGRYPSNSRNSVRGGSNSIRVSLTGAYGNFQPLPGGIYFYRLNTTEDGPGFADIRNQLDELGFGKFIVL